MRVFLDMDGVIVDLLGGMCKFHNLTNPYANPDNYGVYNIANAFGISEEECWGRCEKDFWMNLEPTEEAKELIFFLELRFGRKNICILSAPTLNDGSEPGKKAWIKQHFPQFTNQCLFGKAKHFCANQNSILIDDSDRNIDEFNKAGGFGLLVPRLWNKNYSQVLGLDKKGLYCLDLIVDKCNFIQTVKRVFERNNEALKNIGLDEEYWNKHDD